MTFDLYINQPQHASHFTVSTLRHYPFFFFSQRYKKLYFPKKAEDNFQ